MNNLLSETPLITSWKVILALETPINSNNILKMQTNSSADVIRRFVTIKLKVIVKIKTRSKLVKTAIDNQIKLIDTFLFHFFDELKAKRSCLSSISSRIDFSSVFPETCNFNNFIQNLHNFKNKS